MLKFILLPLIFIFIPTVVLSEPVEEIVVTATRIPQKKEEVPSYVTILTSEDIREMGGNIENVGDVLESVGLGHIHKYPGTLTSKVTVRGFSTDTFGSPYKGNVLILLNGHKIGTANLALIPAENIERIEIVRGPSSVLYGTQAMGGVINIITKDPIEKELHSTLKIEAGNFQYLKGYANLSYRNDFIGILGSYQREKSNSYEVKDIGTYQNTDYRNHSGYLSLVFTPDRNNRLFARVFSWYGWDIGSPGPLYLPSSDDFTNNLKTVYEVGYEGNMGKLVLYHVIDHYEYVSPSYNYVFKSKYNTEGIDYNKSFVLLNSTVVLGTSLERIYSMQPVDYPSQPRSDYFNYAIYGEISNEFFKKLKAYLGLRYDYFRIKTLPTGGLSQSQRTESLDRFSVRGGITYALAEGILLKLNAGNSFRAPSPEELTSDYNVWEMRWVGNPDLKPEKTNSIDSGIEITKGPFKGYFGMFYSNYLNKIISYYDAAKGYYTYKNTSGARISGIEGEGELELAEILGLNFSFKPYFSFTYHTVFRLDRAEKDETTITYVPRWVGTAGIKAGQEKWWLNLYGRYNGEEKIDEFNFFSADYGNIVRKGGFTVVNMAIGIKPIKNLELSMSIENLLNKYYEYVKYYPMPKRNFKISVTYSF